jgi:hypothetical protein
MSSAKAGSSLRRSRSTSAFIRSRGIHLPVEQSTVDATDLSWRCIVEPLARSYTGDRPRLRRPRS